MDIYEQIDPFHFKTNPSDAVRLEKIIDALDGKKYKRALDIGCGEGFITEFLPAEEIYGHDESSLAMSRLPKNVKPLKREEIKGNYDLIVVAGVLNKTGDCNDPDDIINIINKHASGTILLCHRIETEIISAVNKIKGNEVKTITFPYSTKDADWTQKIRIYEVAKDKEKTYIFHNIGTKKHGNYHTAEQVENCNGNLTFDGVYLNVYEYKHLLADRNVILYFIGDYVGKDNSFDQRKKKPIEMFCDMDQLKELEDMGCILGWHTWSHVDLTTLSDEDLEKEVTPPFQMDYFAYPYGKFDDRVIEAVKKAGFKYAHVLANGDNSSYQLNRERL